MKRFLTLLAFAALLASTKTMAQNWLNRIANDYRQRNQRHTTQRINRQQSYQNRLSYWQQNRTNQQREYIHQRSENTNSSNSASDSN